MASYIIVACRKCGRVFAAGVEQKTRTCPYCGGRINLSRCRRLATADNAEEASLIVKRLKRKIAEERKTEEQE